MNVTDLVWTWSFDPWKRSVLRAARKFRSTATNSVILCYDPALDPFDTSLFRLTCDKQAIAVERFLGARLRPLRVYPPRIRVYLFQSSADVSRVYGGQVGGFASWNHRYVVVNLESDWGEILRHELTHIIGGRWNPNASTLLTEGLAVWAQRTMNGVPLDHWIQIKNSDWTTATECLLGPSPPVGSFDRKHYYGLAGSFTGSLIRRFGLARFRKLYQDRAVTGKSFARRFERHFGIALPSALREWLRNLRGRPLPPSLLRRELSF
jgi:hypothetical protein